jgi:TRAP-type C4-dicarboxylate transport system permease small subunit
MKQVSALLSRLAFVLATVAGVALLFMMSVTVLDIAGRTFKLFTIDSGVEQTQLMMVVVGFFGLALCVRVEGNIVVDVATGHLSDRVNRIFDAFWHLVMAAVLALLGYLVLKNGIALDALGQRTELLGLSPLIGHTVAAIGMGVAMVVAVGVAVGIIARGGRGAKDEGNEQG